MGGTEDTYTVKQGDCISSIADAHGFFWKTLWNLNQELQKERTDPNILLPGDKVKIPQLRRKEVEGSTDSKHKFKRKGVPAVLRLVVEHNDLPIANADYTLTVDGVSCEGTTDASGLLVEAIPPTAQKATLIISNMQYELTLGAMDPIVETTGVQLRLQNLGFYHGEIDGVVGPVTQQAIADFQSFSGVEASGEIDGETRQLLLDRQDAEHATVEDSAEEEEADSSQNVDAEDDEDLSDGDALDENEEFPESELEDVDDESDGDGGK